MKFPEFFESVGRFYPRTGSSPFTVYSSQFLKLEGFVLNGCEETLRNNPFVFGYWADKESSVVCGIVLQEIQFGTIDRGGNPKVEQGRIPFRKELLPKGDRVVGYAGRRSEHGRKILERAS